MNKSLAQTAYEAYAKSTGGKTFDGDNMLYWSDLPEPIQDAWKAAAVAAAVEMGKRLGKAASAWGEN